MDIKITCSLIFLCLREMMLVLYGSMILKEGSYRSYCLNESLGTSALVQWDGRNTENKIADMGMYIIFVQLWDPAGNVKEYQESCALIKRQ